MFKNRALLPAVVLAGFLLAVGVISAQEGRTIHRVVEGDTMWDLAGRYLQNSFSWPLIWEANKEQVADPHWIYPGQELVIPPQGFSEQAAAPDTVAVQPVAQQEIQPEAPAEEEPVYEPEPAKPVPMARASRSISTTIKPVPVVSEHMAFAAGYIEEVQSKPAGRIIASDRKHVEGLMANDPVYINLGAADGAKPGDRYALYREGPRVKHPANGSSLGRIINIVGILEITETESKTSRAKLLKTFEPISRNEAFRSYQEVIVPKNVKPLPVERSNEGYIVAVKQQGIAVTEYKTVYIDKGLANGIMPGDVFEIYRTGTKAKDPDRGGSQILPDLVVGHLQVLAVRNNTAAAVLVNSKVEDIQAGERIRLIKQVPSR